MFDDLLCRDLTFLASFTLLVDLSFFKNPLPTSFGLCYDDHLRSSAKESHTYDAIGDAAYSEHLVELENMKKVIAISIYGM